MKADGIVVIGSPDPKSCDVTKPANCLVVGTKGSVQVSGLVRAAKANSVVVREVSFSDGSEFGGPLGTFTPVPLDALQPGSVYAFKNTVDLGLIPPGTTSIVVRYELHGPSQALTASCSGGCAEDALLYYTLTLPPLNLANSAVNSVQNLVGGTFSLLQTKLNTSVQTARANLATATAVAITLKYLNPGAAVNNPPFVGIQNTWTFDPPVLRDGSMSANLTLRYRPDQLPDDPNFVESRMQIVSLDAGGVLRTYPTTLNLTAHTATAQIDSIDPYYTLAVVGPFSKTILNLPAASTGYALVNTGPQDASLTTTAYRNGAGTPVTSTLKSSNLATSGSADLVQTATDSTGVRGVSWMAAGRLLTVSQAVERGTAFAFTDVEFDTRKSTELRWTNTMNFPADTRVTLYNGDGSTFGTYTLTLAPKTAAASRIETLFPKLAKGFVGYSVVSSNQPIVASGSQIANNTATDLAAQPITDANFENKTRYAPRLGESEGAATLHLVNLGSATASITLRGRTAAGGAAGSSVTISLAAGRQYSRPLADIFSVAANTVASVQIDSTTTGILGDLFTADSAFIPTYGVSLPLTADPRTSLVLPYATGSTAVYLYNPGSTAANVGATAYAANGTKGAASSTTVPAFGRASLQVSSTGYVAISSSQPVLAAGFPTTDAGAISGYLALPSAAAAAPPITGVLPAATAAGVVNAASFQGASVSPGEIVTIFGSNFGTSALTLLALLSNGRVSTDAAQTRFLFDNIAAPIVYVTAGQASVIVPYTVAGKSTTQLVIEYQGRRSDPITLNVSSAAPALFSYNSSGSGPGAILNQNGSVNTAQNPAAKGSVVVLFGTGEGGTNPPVADGSVTGGIVRPLLPVTVTIGGIAQKVLYAGAAPSLVAGVLQVNVEIDPATPGGNQPVVVTVGGASSQSGLTVAIAGGGTTSAPVIVLEPTSLDFLSVPVGQTKDLTVTVRNTGNATLTVNSVTSSNGRFALAILGTPFNVGAGSFQTATIRFSPTAATTETGTLTFANNDPANPSRTLSVTGTGTAVAAPVIVLEPTSLDFLSVPVGQTKDLTVTVRNTGNATLAVN